MRVGGRAPQYTRLPVSQHGAVFVQHCALYRGTSLMRNSAPPGPYSRTTRPYAVLGRGAVSHELGNPARLGLESTTARTASRCPSTAQSSFRAPNLVCRERVVIDNLLVRIHLIIEMIVVDRPCVKGV